MYFFLLTIAIMADFTMIMTFAFFLRPLAWWHEADRAAIVGFWSMILAVMLNMALLIFGELHI